jgi:hypothetical protein
MQAQQALQGVQQSLQILQQHVGQTLLQQMQAPGGMQGLQGLQGYQGGQAASGYAGQPSIH